MTPDDDGAAPSVVGERLAAAIRDEPGLTTRGLARELAGPGATDNQLDNKRRLINGWKAGEGISDENAELLARRFDKPVGYFKTPKGERRRQRDRLAVLEETAIRGEDLDRAVRPLREAIFALARGDTRGALRALSEEAEA